MSPSVFFTKVMRRLRRYAGQIARLFYQQIQRAGSLLTKIPKLYKRIKKHLKRPLTAADFAIDGFVGPLLTIAVPTYNRASDIDQLLGSILRQVQALPNGVVEVLISDNASADNTPDVVAKYAALCPAIRSVRNPKNIGMQANFGQCMDICHGYFLQIIGDDEAFLEGGLEIVLEALRKQQASVYVFNYACENWPQPKFLYRVGGKPIDTKPANVMDFVYRHGWFWTLANLGMVVVKAAPVRAINRTPHLGHSFMQAAVYLEAFAKDKLLFVDEPVFETFVRSQTVNKERWEHDGNIASWPETFHSLQHLISQGVLPATLPTLFFNGCSCEWRPVWGMFLDQMIKYLTSGSRHVTDAEWDNVRRWIDKLADTTLRDKTLASVNALQAQSASPKSEAFQREAYLLQLVMQER